MSIRHLLDHTCRVWRRVEERDTYGEIEVGYELVYADLPVAIDPPDARLANPGPGVYGNVTDVLFFDSGPDLQTRDLIEIFAGPDAPRNFQAEGRPAEVRGHHMELMASIYPDEAPEVAS